MFTRINNVFLGGKKTEREREIHLRFKTLATKER